MNVPCRSFIFHHRTLHLSHGRQSSDRITKKSRGYPLPLVRGFKQSFLMTIRGGGAPKLIWWRGGLPVVLGDQLEPEFLLEKFSKRIFYLFRRYVTSGALDYSRICLSPIQDPFAAAWDTVRDSCISPKYRKNHF